MYLPKEVIVKLLQKADPLLATLPLYVSSEVGHQKTTRKLFLHVYSDLDYCYEKWIHIGDNRFADQVQPEMLGIQTAPIPVPEWTLYEKRLADYSSHYEFRCVAKQIQSFRLMHPAGRAVCLLLCGTLSRPLRSACRIACRQAGLPDTVFHFP